MAKPKKLELPAPTRIVVPPVAVGITIPAGPHTGGRDGRAFGDIVTELYVNGGRSEVASRLESLASVIRCTEGDDVVSGTIVVLMRHRRSGGVGHG